MGSAAIPVPSQWIISKREDLTWFIGSSVVSYAALAMLVAGFPILPLQIFWFFGVDGPHVLATVTRTYLDRAERRRLGAHLWVLFPLLAVGPVMAIAGHASLFFLLAVCWQHFHIVKQHFGFVMLYKAKNNERDPRDLALDRWFLLGSLFVPLTIFLIHTQPRLTVLVPASQVALLAYGLLAAAWIARQFQKHRTGLPMNGPKMALIAAVVPLQWCALVHAAHYGPAGILRAGITLGLFHSFQYHRLMWFHNRNRYSGPDAEARHGFAVLLASHVSKYLALAVGLNVVLSFLPPLLFPSEAVQAAVWGIPFTHYCLDARIWKVRSDSELASALKLS